MENSLQVEQIKYDVDYRNSGILKGIPSSNGIVIAKAYVLENFKGIITDDNLENIDVKKEIDKLENAYQVIIKEFEDAYNKVKNSNSSIKSIIESNVLILKDNYIKNEIIKIIKFGYSAESSILKEFEIQKSFFKNSRDPILRERSYELDHIQNRLISELKHQFINYEYAKGKILVCDNVTPTDLVNFYESGIVGLITEVGGIASHVSIMSRAYKLPSVIGIKEASSLIKNDFTLILDGFLGLVYYNPTFSLIKQYKKKLNQIIEQRNSLGYLIDKDCITKDNKRIIISANADNQQDIEYAILNGAESIGLFRSESLILNNNIIPDQETQYQYYKKCAEILYPKEFTIRAFDIGNDKYSEGIPYTENNPALGFRGIRYLLARDDIFKNQILAVLRASSIKNIKFMIPMVTNIEEVIRTKIILNECKEYLRQNNKDFDENIKFGVMLETPASILISESLSHYCDFFSLGTNDLTQYTLATDRENNLVAEYFDTFHPAVLYLINYAIKVAKSKNVKISVCGEFASHSAATKLLIGMGIDELSVAPPMILDLKSRILNISYKSAKKISNKILRMTNSSEILAELENNSI